MSVLEPKQQTKTVLVTALISAVSTIAVSFIAILPVILKADGPRPVNSSAKVKTLTDLGWRISGRVLDDATDKPVSAQLFLLKADSVRQTDDGGKFVFDHVPKGTYLIQVEVGDSQGKRSNRYLIEPSKDPEDKRSHAGGPWLNVLMGPTTQE